MRTLRVMLVLGMVALIAAFVGCSDVTKVVNEGGLTSDQQAVTDLVNQSQEFDHDVVSHSVPDTTASLVGGATGAAADARFWWRQYSGHVREVTVNAHPADQNHTYPYADVTIHTTFTGTLQVVHRDEAGSYTRSSQPITDVFVQYATFEQYFSATSPNRGWLCTEISNIRGGSEPSDLEFTSLNVHPAHSPERQFEEVDFTTLYNPAFRMAMEPDEQVYLMAQSGSGSNRLFRHDWTDGSASRVEMTNQDLGFYSNTLTTPTSLTAAQVQRFLVVDVVAPNVIEAGATYDAIVWAIPYLVASNGGNPQ